MRLLDLLDDWTCPDADCAACRLFDLPSDAPAFDRWMSCTQRQVAADPYVLTYCHADRLPRFMRE